MQTKTTRTTSREEQEVAQILRYNPLRFVREAYIRFIQGLFSQAPKGWFHWDPDPDDTDILITDENPVKIDVYGKRPCITCTRAPVSLFTLGLDDLLQYNMASGARRKSVLIPGTMSINCCSRVALESEQLAWVVAEHIWMLRDVMRRWGFYDVGRNLAIGAPSPPGSIIQNDSGDEWYATVITSPFHMTRMSEVTPLNRKIAKSIEVMLSGQLDGRIPQGYPYSNTPNMPYALDANLAPSDLPAVGGHVAPSGLGEIESHSLPTAAHPLNPAVRVFVQPARPGDPLVRQPSIHGRTIPIRREGVEESLHEQRHGLIPQIVKT